MKLTFVIADVRNAVDAANYGWSEQPRKRTRTIVLTPEQERELYRNEGECILEVFMVADEPAREER
jgi:hypothetical protein